MPAVRDHTEYVYQVAHRSSAAASSPVAASWRRCMTLHGLAPEDRRTPVRLSDSEFRLARQRSAELIAEAGGELDRLFATVGKAGCCLLLTDDKGVALERRGAVGDDADFRDVGLWSGTIWSEASVGTNGIGTAIADERAVIIQRDQHFLSSNIGLSCTTAPIRDHLGRLAAAIDISTCRDDASEITVSLLSQAVRDAAARIEAGLFRRAFAGSCSCRSTGQGRHFWLSIATTSSRARHARRGNGSDSTTNASPRAFRHPIFSRRIRPATGASFPMPSGPRFGACCRAPMAMCRWQPNCSASAAPRFIAR